VHRIAALAVLVAAVVAARPAHAAPAPWYAYYLDAHDKLIPAKRYAEALQSLEQAVRLKPESALNEQTYGLEFIHYLPYFYEGKCYLALSDYQSAILRFNIEEKKGQTQRKDALYRELKKLRADAEASQAGVDTAEKVKRLGQEVARLETDAALLHKEGKYDQGLTQLG